MPLSLLIIFACFLLSTATAGTPPTVAVDVGHTLAEPGAISARGRGEFEFNRELAGPLAAALRARNVKVREVNFVCAIGSLAERSAQARYESLVTRTQVLTKDDAARVLVRFIEAFGKTNRPSMPSIPPLSETGSVSSIKSVAPPSMTNPACSRPSRP